MTSYVIPPLLHLFNILQENKQVIKIRTGCMIVLATSVQWLFATPVNDQPISEVQVSMELKHESLVKAFQKIESQTRFRFMYRNEDVKNISDLSIPSTRQSVEAFLKTILFNTTLWYRQVNNHILIRPSEKNDNNSRIPTRLVAEIPKDSIINGQVTNAKGEPLAGVSIALKGTNTGTSTDATGKFSITAPGNGTLVISSVGFKSQEIGVKGLSNIFIKLETLDQSLGEVVVTALGMRKEKKALTFAVTELNGDELTKARENNLGNALTGKIAGVNASSSATGPGGSSRVVIRGNGSLSGENQPLYIVNGVPINNANQGQASTYGGVDRGDGLLSINPDDIESISVLKGGTAAALYGSRAANGVILITTKPGKAQRGIGVEWNSTYTLENPLTIPDWQYEYGSGSRGAKPTSQAEAVANGRISWGAKLDGSMVVNPDGIARPYSAQKSNVRNFYDNGQTFSNTVAVAGGSDVANFRFSLSNMENKGIVPKSTVDRKTFNLSVNGNLAQKIIFEARGQYNIEKNNNRTYIADFTKNPNAAVGLIATNIDVRTLAPGYDSLGYETPWSDYVFVVNPYFAASKVRNNDERRRFIGSFSTRYNITSYLYARARMGIDYFTINGVDIEPTGLLYNPTGSMTTDHSDTYETNMEALLGFDKRLKKFSITAIAGGNKMYNKLTGTTISSGLFNVPFSYFVTNGKSPTFTQAYRESAINSLFASADIGCNDYLYLSLTGRKDWFSTLSPKSNSLFYPSMGLSFIFSDVWQSKPSWLNYGKIRSSWAQVGGGAPDPYGLSLAYVAPSSSHLGQPLMNISGNTIPNAVLKPYTSTTIEFGLEVRAINNRVGADITLYDRTTTNDIVSASVPLSSGYQSVLLNVGKMRNKGIELLLNGTPVKSLKRMNWDVSFNMAYNENTVIKIADGLPSLALPGAQTRTLNGFVYHYEGMPFGMISGYRAKQDAKGNIVYNADNGLPVQSEFMALGRGVPPLTMGLSNTFGYKNFTFSFLLDGKFGSKIYTSTNAYGTYYGLDKRTVANGVREKGIALQGVDTDGNPFTKTIDAEDYYEGIAFSLTDQFVSDAGFIKLRQLTLGYTFPQKLLNKTPFQFASLSLVARNLLLLYSQVKNVDPESNYNTSNAQGLENFGVPPVRSYGLNLMVKF